MHLETVEPPAGPGFTLADVKAYLNMYDDLTDQDATLSALAGAAVHLVENQANTFLIARTVKEARTVPGDGVLRMLRGPVLSLESVALDGVDLASDEVAAVERIGPARFRIGRPGAKAAVVYRCGLAETAADVPDAAKVAVWMLAANAFEGRASDVSPSSLIGGLITSLSWGGGVPPR